MLIPALPPHEQRRNKEQQKLGEYNKNVEKAGRTLPWVTLAPHDESTVDSSACEMPLVCSALACNCTQSRVTFGCK